MVWWTKKIELVDAFFWYGKAVDSAYAYHFTTATIIDIIGSNNSTVEIISLLQ